MDFFADIQDYKASLEEEQKLKETRELQGS